MVIVMERVLIVEAAKDPVAGVAAVAARAFPGAQLRCVATVSGAFQVLGEEVFDLALVDPQRLDGGPLGVAQVIHAVPPGTVAVVVNGVADDETLLATLRAGAFGYLLKDEPADDLVAALQALSQGEPPLSPSVARRLLRFLADGVQVASVRHEDVGLNARETEILQRVAKGFTLPEIAAQLGLSRHTVADYVKQIYRKLNVSSRAEAALEAARLGLVRP